MTSTRDQILDAFETLVLDQGERAATLDAVAKAAGLSKGGLLYHFGSKHELVLGEVERLERLAELDVLDLLAAPDGPVATFILSSIAGDSTFDRAFMIALRLAQSAQFPEVTSALDRVEARWVEIFTDALGDATLARLVLLMSDGMYYRSALFPHAARDTHPAVDDVLAVIEQLRATRHPGSTDLP
jgi:AcrR family transcriptional regulator